MTKELIATQGMTYATRRLRPGQTFQASDRDADLLIRIKRARKVSPLDAPPAALAEKVAQQVDPDAEMKALRTKYLDVFGKRPGPKWGPDELSCRIAEAAKA
ncbi:hypothetical protein GHV40_01035 [Devosia sp. D6-9]|nr:hypothetical protein GHV40_01035 [Devosia sp. D6-9]